ncbi:MAG: guanylate kinase [Betaproteobacteria bacterium]|jgi:guanylate kinase|uniref:Guanylate kinase n=1 Tax=Thiomonas delicata TaxID=364030 RepID=A0A238D568_THIDL|nr:MULTISPECIES: guanylate kinase [Thiomonas]MDE2129016.1 guanylate kinase [Betaproteobacteria bacterium]OZB45373.1 MAG: guanylate kinase [Thiomonas sp. 15-66-11]OZB63646.1 MAG: guanylate kinase [Thiomonas sp. 13-66-29]SBP88371.1 guanylate kinase [Thiomonas delicata]
MDFPGNLFVVAAPSGAGKSSLVQELLSRDAGIQLSVSYTTRAPRGQEQDGREYLFIDRAEFEKRIKAGDFLEWAEVHGNLYGTSRHWLQQRMTQGVDVMLEIDWQGAEQVKQQFSNAVSIYILPPSYEELEARLMRRGEDAAEVIVRRLRDARVETPHASTFDFIIVNHDFSQALSDLQAVVAAQRLRYAAQRRAHPEVFKALGIL